MKYIIFFLVVGPPLVHSELHTLNTTYTGINGQTAAGTPEFSAVTTLDDHQIDYYDSNIKKLIPRQDWMKEFASTEMWREYTEIREKQQQIYKINIHVLMETFNEAHGVYVYQRRYGCEYDDETEDSRGFDQYGYDGEDFISLDLKENRYISPVPQGFSTVMKWNNDREQLTYLKEYYYYKCVYWLRKFLHLSKATTEKTEPPEMSLLQKKQDHYTCHVTGFLYRDTSILWRKNGQAMDNYSTLVESKDTLPNGDGTFQRRLTLHIHPDIHEDEYTCVVEHKSWTDPIQKSMTVNKISTNDTSNIMNLAIVFIITVIVGLIGLIGLCVLWKKLKAYSKKRTTIYFKSKLSQEQAPSQVSLLSTPSNESSSPLKDGIFESVASPDSLRDKQNHALEPSSTSPVDGSSQPFLTTDSFYKVQETSEDF